jgi:small subunit ribosomal protein S15
MSLLHTLKKKIIDGFRLHGKDTGSAGVQIALLTERINALTKHLKTHKQDFHSRAGLFRMVGARRKLLAFLERSDVTRYKKLIKKLKLRK